MREIRTRGLKRGHGWKLLLYSMAKIANSSRPRSELCLCLIFSDKVTLINIENLKDYFINHLLDLVTIKRAVVVHQYLL